ncbi:type VI secretion system baseplate subunit TssE [Candidatus Curculioniphilus buchneri]|uniref:type VI secretion system baseplate subunit TssE n=1 Tax=Candidatus Curculioniphilus buchneri TaxID=690594 RepID=UPI00376ECF93
MKRQTFPFLLERLTHHTSDTYENSIHLNSSSILHSSILNYLQALLNCTQPQYLKDLDDHNHLIKSVLNFGIPPLAGKYLAELSATEIIDVIKTAILRFEPRIIADCLRIDLVQSLPHFMSSPYLLLFVIKGCLKGMPESIGFTYYSHLDLENGHIELSE